MRTRIYLSLGLLLGASVLPRRWARRRDGGHIHPAESGSHQVELEYLKSVNRVAPPKDPQLLFLLMGAYANAHRETQGVEFLSARLGEFGPRLSNPQRALYLSAIGLLRAQHSASVPLRHRMGYANETIATLNQAKTLSDGQIFVVNWISGVVRVQLPRFFRQQQTAKDDLEWCIANADKAPHIGWLREVNFGLGKLALGDGDRSKARKYLRQSGYTSFDKPIVLTTAFSEETLTGHMFSSRRIAEIVPGRVYALSGFEFTEYYFVVSDDRRELIGIDAGTRADSAKVAYEALRAYAPHLPPLITILVTHSHWDHIGGHAFFDSLAPKPRFYARRNYDEEIASDLNAPESLTKHFFGEGVNFEDMRNFKPDETIDGATDLTIGCTRIECIPIQGGETRDALFVHKDEQS